MSSVTTPGTAEPVAAPKDQALDKRLLAWWQGVPLSFRIVGGIGVVFVFFFIRFTVDDAFISWRYALTLVRSGEWNYSAGLPRVEGYTNFLFAAVAVLPALLHIPIELFFKVLALGILGGYLLAVRRCALSRLQTLALVAIVLCNPGFMIMLFSGLETVSFALLIALVFGLVYRNGGLGPWGYVAAFALSLSRPEGIVLAGVAMVWSLVVTRQKQQLGGLLVVVGAWGLYWVARWSYFGYFWPSSYYVKSGSRGDASAQLLNVLSSLVPVAVNPNVRAAVDAEFAHADRVHVTDPLDYPDLVWVLRRSALVLTDSGGIQEEAPSFGVPLLVLREVTERREAVDAGYAWLVGTDAELIRAQASRILGARLRLSPDANPYGDGQAAPRCVAAIAELLALR